MKFIAVFIIFAAFFSVIIADSPQPRRRCDFKCTGLDGSICASNRKCLHLFPSQCQMEKYNCLFPPKSFKRIESWKCNESSMPLCSKGDL